MAGTSVGVPVGVGRGSAVEVGAGVWVGVAVGDAVAVGVGIVARIAVAVGEGDGTGVAGRITETVGEGDSVGVGVGDEVRALVEVGVATAAEAVGDSATVRSTSPPQPVSASSTAPT